MEIKSNHLINVIISIHYVQLTAQSQAIALSSLILSVTNNPCENKPE